MAFARSCGRSVDEIMTRNPVCVAPGMISKAELPAAVERKFDQSTHTGRGVRDDILVAIRKQRWAAGAIVDVVVTNGEVQMWGVIVDPTQRNPLKVLIENVSGVDHVTDHLKLRDELPL